MPWRTEGRKHYHEEQYYLGVYLLALAQHGLIVYPFAIEKDESPDFFFSWQAGQRVGVEVTRATKGWLQRDMTAAEKHYRRNESISEAQGNRVGPASIPSSSAGPVGDEAEKRLCDLVRVSVEKKLAKFPNFKTASRYDILIYDESPLPAIHRGKIMNLLNPWVRKLMEERKDLGQVSLIISLDVIFNLGETPLILPVAVHLSK